MIELIPEFLPGDTAKLTWINSGVSPDGAPVFSVIDGAETVVDTGTLTSSGNGHYFAFVTVPDTVGLYVCKTETQISGYSFKRSSRFRVENIEVD